MTGPSHGATATPASGQQCIVGNMHFKWVNVKELYQSCLNTPQLLKPPGATMTVNHSHIHDII